jgi:hypothetical protein
VATNRCDGGGRGQPPRQPQDAIPQQQEHQQQQQQQQGQEDALPAASLTLAPIVAGSSSSPPPPPPPPPTGGVVVIEVAELRRDATKARHWYLRAVQLGFDAGAVAAALSSLFSTGGEPGSRNSSSSSAGARQLGPEDKHHHLPAPL